MAATVKARACNTWCLREYKKHPLDYDRDIHYTKDQRCVSLQYNFFATITKTYKSRRPARAVLHVVFWNVPPLPRHHGVRISEALHSIGSTGETAASHKFYQRNVMPQIEIYVWYNIVACPEHFAFQLSYLHRVRQWIQYCRTECENKQIRNVSNTCSG